MSQHEDNSVLITGALVGDIYHSPGKVLRFTLGGESLGLLNPKRKIIHYQEAVVLGYKADEEAKKIKAGGAYAVAGPLVTRRTETGTRYQIKTFDVNPINRDVEAENGGVDRNNQRRLEDAISHARLIGNIGKPPRPSWRGETLVVRAPLATHIAIRKGGEWVEETHWITLVAEDDLGESLLAAQVGSRLIALGNLFTERFTVPGDDGSPKIIKRSCVLASILDYIGTDEDEEAAEIPEDEIPEGAELLPESETEEQENLDRDMPDG